MGAAQPLQLLHLGRYEVVAELGRGAMGIVYRARDPELERTVAIKTVNMALEEDGAAQYEARFHQEARAAGGLNHPNIVTIHDIGKSGEVAFMAMEYIDGVELRALLRPEAPLPLPQAVSIAAQIAEGLAYAHEHGVVHRDIKPANIIVLASGQVKITDFGIARMRASALQTQTGAVMGSPKYMSPEQVLGRRADHRSDIFSLGIILYEMLSGTAPFKGKNPTSLTYQTVNFAPPAPSALQPLVPDLLDAIVAKMLAKAIEERYQSAAELARDLRACEQELTIPIVRGSTEPPTRGVARGFDSNEATLRLAALTVSAPGAVDPAASTLLQPARRRWGRRDLTTILCAALAGAAVAALILLR